MPSNHCRPLLLLPSMFPSIRVFSSESALCIRWPKYCSFIISISPSREYSGLISFRIDWFNLLAVQWQFSNTTVRKHQFFGAQPSLYGGRPAFLEVWRLLPPFRRCSVGTVTHASVFWCICGGGRWSPHITLPPSSTRLEKLTFDVRNPTCFAVWLSVFFPQIVGPKIVASGDSTILPLLISNGTDVQLNVPIKNAKVKKKKKGNLSERENAQVFKICLLASSCSRPAYSCPLLISQMAHSVQVCFAPFPG